MLLEWDPLEPCVFHPFFCFQSFSAVQYMLNQQKTEEVQFECYIYYAVDVVVWYNAIGIS